MKPAVFVDRIEVVEEGEPLAVVLLQRAEGDYLEWLVPLNWLPEGTREGDWLTVQFTPAPELREQVHQEIEDLLRDLQGE